MDNEKENLEEKLRVRTVIKIDGRKSVRPCSMGKSDGIVIQPSHYRAKLLLIEDGSYHILGTNTPGFEKMAYGIMEMLGLEYEEKSRIPGQITGSYIQKKKE